MSDRTPRGAAAASPAPRPPDSACTAVLAECPTNDDESERRQRRRSRAADFSLDLGSSAPRVEGSQLPQWSNAQISEHYRTCLRLAMENKITPKNAFDLHLIDYMSEILKQSSESTSFKVAAGALDACAKIYSARVDMVYAGTYKLLEGLGKDSAPAKGLDSPGEEDSSAPEAVKKVQPKKKQAFKTIEENLNNINVSEANRRRQVDPMFQKALASFDVRSTAGIFLRRLQCQDFRCELQFESMIVPLPSSETLSLPNSDPVKMKDLKSLLARCVEKRPICSSLAGFQFTKWDEESHEESVLALLDKFKKSEHVFDPNAEVESDGAGCVPPLPEDDFHSDSPGSRAEKKLGEFTDNINSFGTISQNQSKRTDGALFGEGDAETMCRHLSMNPGEYSYFSPRILSMWAGPQHWHLQLRHTSNANSEKETRKRNVKEVFELNFDEKVDFEAYFRKTKASTTLAKSTLERQNVRSTTLPADFNYNPQDFLQLFLKPLVKINRTSEPVTTLESEDAIGDYDYNNPNDTTDFCPALQVADGDDDDDNDPSEFLAQMGVFSPQGLQLNSGEDITTSGELSLVAEPQKIKKIAIPYAKTAVEIDMRRLKEAMWQQLTDGQKKGTVGEVEDTEKEKDTSVVVGVKKLSDVVKDLRRSLPAAMATNLTWAVAFVCLLHVATEKNLNLEGTEDMSDVLVTQNSEPHVEQPQAGAQCPSSGLSSVADVSPAS